MVSAVRERITWPVFFVLGLLLATSGCATRRAAREVAGAEYRVRSVEIEGNEAVDEDSIREHLYLRPTRWFPLPQRRYFFEGYVPIDMDRIERVYETKGYYDAKTLDSKIEKSSRRNVVNITFLVDEGRPTLLESIDFTWPRGRLVGDVASEEVETWCDLEIGEPFDVSRMHEAEASMKASLMGKGFAFAEVEATAHVDPGAHRARVDYALRPGPRVHIGEIRLEGLVSIPEKPVRTEFEDFEGRMFSPSRLEAIEQAVYGLGVFSSVVVVPDASPRGDVVDLTVRVTEGDPQRIRVGVGLAFEPARWEQYAAITYSHENLFRSLTHFDVRLKVGYAELPRLIDIEDYKPVLGVEEHGPVLELTPRLRKKGLIERKLVWEWAPRFELGIQQGYQYYSPSNRIGVSRFFTRFVEVNLSHNLQFFDHFNRSSAFSSSDTLLGPDYRDPYLISYIELAVWLHLTNRVLDPRNGVVVGAVYDIAGGIFGGNYDYNKITPEIRGYWTPIRNRLQFTARAQVGLILPFGDEPGAPFGNKYYLGGASTVRGFGLRRLSPYLPMCSPDEADCEPIPVGGNTMVLGNVEARVRVWRDLWIVSFFDMGDVQPGELEFRPSQWNYSAGPGIRYKSRVGTFRLDFGIRINETDRFDDQARWALHFGLGETF